MARVPRKVFYLAGAVLIVAVALLGGAGTFRDAGSYLIGLLLPDAKVTPPPPVTVRETPVTPPVDVKPEPVVVIPPQPPLPSPVLPRPPAATPNPQFVVAQRYEAQGDSRNAWTAYLMASTIPGPHVEDSLLGVVRMLIAGGPIHKHASVCAQVKSLRTQFPVPRADLAEQTATTLAAANCGQ
jgi:hypothetical protein